ncbi:MAG: hypothetical protein J6X55_16275, partial [Victivallales bacterium]|nr:hypothetical protein [Victivallales bacterium]
MLEKLKQYKESMYEAMAQAENLGASAVKISFDHDEGISASYESGRLKYADASESMAFAILVIVDGKFGKAAANQPETLNEMVRRAVKLAETGAPAHFATFPKPAMKYDGIQSFDQATAELPRTRIVEDCGKLVDAIKSLHPSMVVNAAGSRIVAESLTINNAGLYDEFQESSWKIGAGFSKTTGTDMLFCSAARGWGKLDEHYDLDYIVNTVTENYKNASRIARLPDGKYPLLLPPKFVQRFLAPVKMGLNGFNVYLGTSPLKDKLGQTPFDSSFSLY